MERIAVYTVEQVLGFVGVKIGADETKVYHNEKIKMGSSRYKNFLKNGTACVKCGIKGRFFAMERAGCLPYHFNLYAVDKDGNEVLMTQDHIVPKSRGGSNKLNNLQPMCSRCNAIKGCRLEEEFIFSPLLRVL